MAKPAVDGLQQEMSKDMAFTRVNIKEPEGQQIGRKYQVRAVPTFLLIAPDGKILYRQTGGKPDTETIRQKLAEWTPPQPGS